MRPARAPGRAGGRPARARGRARCVCVLIVAAMAYDAPGGGIDRALRAPCPRSTHTSTIPMAYGL
eukprot:5968411-Prymnesium_polylepis.1